MSELSDIQLLNFTLAEDVFGLDIKKVQEIRALGEVRALPYSPDYCIGVIEFRENMVPIVDLRILFGYEKQTIDKHTVVIISTVSIDDTQMMLGTVVDSVSDVVSLNPDKLKKPPVIGNEVEAKCVVGMFKADEKIILMLALESLISGQAFGTLRDLIDQDDANDTL